MRNVARLGEEPREGESPPRLPPSPPGTPRITLFEGSASVAWEPSLGSAHHKVLCADLERHQVGYVDVEPGKTQVLIENVSGKYRIDIVAFNGAGASAPKQAFFDCSRSALAKEELESAFQEFQQYQKFAPPRRPVAGRAERDEESLSPRPAPDYAGRDRQRTEALTLSPEQRRNAEERKRSVQSPSRHGHGLDVGASLHDAQPKASKESGPRSRGRESPRLYSGRRSPSPDSSPPRRQRSRDAPSTARERDLPSPDPLPFDKSSRFDKSTELHTPRGRGIRPRGPFAPRYDGFARADERDESPGWEELSGLQEVKPLEQMLVQTARQEAAQKSPGPKRPQFKKWYELDSPQVPSVVPRALGSRPPASTVADEGKMLLVRQEVHEDTCILRWGWRGKAPSIGAYTVFGARLGEKWDVAGRLQYGESSFTARHLPRGKTYAFVVFATPVGTFEEGWVSRVVTVVVNPGKPAPPRNVSLTLEQSDTVVARWEPAKEDKSGEAITGYKVRAEDSADGTPGTLLCEVPAACTTLSWPYRRYQGGSAITVATVSAHRVESERISSALELPEASKTAEVLAPTIELAPDGTPTIMVHWVASDPMYRYAVLVKVRGARRVRRFPVTVTPATCVLEPGQEVVAALEADSQATGPRVSAWSHPVGVPARPPSAPGRPCVRQAAHDLQLSWAPPLDCKDPVSYLVVVEAQDGRRAEAPAGKQPYWTVPLDDLLDHFHKTRLRFAVIAVGSAGRSPISPWSPKQLFQPSDDWQLRSSAAQRTALTGRRGEETGRRERSMTPPRRSVTPTRKPAGRVSQQRPPWKFA